MANVKKWVEYGYKVEYGKFEKTIAKISNKSHLKQNRKSVKNMRIGLNNIKL